VRLFSTLELEVTSRCNRHCSFCPNSVYERPTERMDRALIEKACAELGALKYHGRLSPYVYNEPMRDAPQLEWALETFRRLAPRSKIIMSSNGDFLRKLGGASYLEHLYDLGLNAILLNAYEPGLYEAYVDMTRTVKALPGSIWNATVRGRTIDIQDKSNSSGFGTGTFALQNNAGLNNLPVLSAPLERMCVMPFRMLQIRWNGDGVICCNDYHGWVPIGNVRTHTLLEIWNHKIINTYRDRLLKKDRSLPMCAKCDMPVGPYPHNVTEPSGERASVEEITVLHDMNRNATEMGLTNTPPVAIFKQRKRDGRTTQSH
jgi:MoaA/NifB/PqqE/SkfB family radical SAM enzyme